MSKTKRRMLAVTAGLLLIAIVAQLVGWHGIPYTHTVEITPRVVLREHHLRQWSLFIGIADSSGSVFLPIPYASDTIISTDLLMEGHGVRSYGPYADFYSSPDQRVILVEPGLHAKPFELLNVDTGAMVRVDVPPGVPQSHYFVYPFGFLRWSGDTVIVEVTGTYVKGPGRLLAYRELWEIDATTGGASHISREEQPWSEHLEWAP